MLTKMTYLAHLINRLCCIESSGIDLTHFNPFKYEYMTQKLTRLTFIYLYAHKLQ